MTIDVRPASVFEDVRSVIGPKSPQANVCWCLSYRIPSKLNNELRGPDRGGYVAGLCRGGPPPPAPAAPRARARGGGAPGPRARAPP
ncbi:GNAT family N-acetyltransferase, partial [Streptomyces sp. NPDC059037]